MSDATTKYHNKFNKILCHGALPHPEWNLWLACQPLISRNCSLHTYSYWAAP